MTTVATAPGTTEIDLRDSALPVLLAEEIDVDALPAKHRDVLIWQRLARMRPGEAVRLTSAADLHPVWRRQHACNHNSHIWIYEDCGPVRWRARVTRRSPDDY